MDSNVKQYLYDKVKREFLLGRNGNKPIIPKEYEINKVVNDIIDSSNNGIIGSMAEFNTKVVSNHIDYNDNMLNIKDNIEFSLGDVEHKINRVIDQINESTTEKNNTVRELRKLNESFTEIEAGRITDNGLSYNIIDSFNDVSKVDLNRSTVDLNVSAGTVGLRHSTAGSLQFPHYVGLRQSTFSVTEGGQSIVKEGQLPGSSFGDMFNPDNTKRWEYVIQTSKPVNVSAYFTLKLDAENAPIEINEINIKFMDTASSKSEGVGNIISVEFLDPTGGDNKWRKIPGASSALSSAEVSFKFNIPATTHIRFIFDKNWPDVTADNEYKFGITELTVKKSETVYESVLTSRSLEMKPYQRERTSIHSVMLSDDVELQEGSDIQYLVGLDDVVPGKVLNANGTPVDVDSEEAYEFVPNEVGTNGVFENYYTYASDLRSNQHISGSYSYREWEPRWQHIGAVNNEHNNITNVLFFNSDIIKKDIHDMYYEIPVLWDDPKYTGPWPETGTAWADDWEGNAGASPKSGYIYGDGYLHSDANTTWNSFTGNPGWWRPHTPDASGMQTWEDEHKRSTPDFTLPVYNSDGAAVTDDDGNPLQKHFWKIFKWPSDALPVHGSVKFFIDNFNHESSTTSNSHSWKWNFRYKDTIKDISTSAFIVRAGLYYYNLVIDDEIVKGSIRNLRFIDFEPSEVEDIFVDYGYDWYYDEDAEKTQRTKVDAVDANSHATISFPSAISSYKSATGDSSPTMMFDYQYKIKDSIGASWETFMYVPPHLSDVVNYAFINNDTDNAIDKVIVYSLNAHGIILNQQVIPESDYSQFELPTGWSKLRVFVKIDTLLGSINDTDGDTIALWNPSDFKTSEEGDDIRNFSYSDTVKVATSQNSMTEVDLYTLMHDTAIDNNDRFAIITDSDGSEYAVVKTPYHKTFPTNVHNSMHYTRTYLGIGGYTTFTTGTSGNIDNIYPDASKYDPNAIVNDRPPNTNADVYYPNISTYNTILQVGDLTSNNFLFWDTAENLEAYYRVEYNKPVDNRPSNKVLVKAVLSSDNPKTTPVMRSYSIHINSKYDVERIT